VESYQTGEEIIDIVHKISRIHHKKHRQRFCFYASIF
jgi:hypothetical protein